MELSFVLKAASHNVTGDGARLHQVFWNVVKNAIKFTLPGGQVVVRTINPVAGRLCLTISDTGVGIDPKLLPSIFCAFEKPLSKDDRHFNGLGLGLAISKTIVEMHGGSIRAESAGEGQGSTFTIELNTAELQCKPSPSTRKTPTANGPHYRLLVVEDHQPTLDVLAGLLRRQRHEVLTANTVQNALGLAASHSLDLVISDLGLPDGDGVDLMSKLTREYGLRGIALSGYGMEEDIAKTKQVGFIAHLVKPIQFEKLNQAIRQFSQAA